MPGPCVDRCKSLKNLGSFKISEKGFALYQTLKTAVFNRGGEGGTRPALQVIEDGRKPVKKKD